MPEDAGQGPAEGADEIEELRRRLHASVSRVCPRWLAGQVDDIVQVAVLRVLDACRNRGGIGKVASSYLQKAAYSAAVDEIRRHSRRREVSIEDEPEMSLPPSRITGPEQRCSASEIARGIRECLAGLGVSRRHAVTLYLQGYTVPEIGRALAYGLTKAEHLVYRGLTNLRECLATKGLAP